MAQLKNINKILVLWSDMQTGSLSDLYSNTDPGPELTKHQSGFGSATFITTS